MRLVARGRIASTAQGRVASASTRGILPQPSWILAKSGGVLARTHLDGPWARRMHLPLGEGCGVRYSGRAPVDQLLYDLLGRH